MVFVSIVSGFCSFMFLSLISGGSGSWDRPPMAQGREEAKFNLEMDWIVY